MLWRAKLAFGDGQGNSGSCNDASPLHFTGKERDSETALDYFGRDHTTLTLLNS